MAGVALIVNPAKVSRARRFREVVDAELAARGLPSARYLLTTVADPGGAQAREALDSGASRVLVAGGDGTVRMVLGELRGSGLPVGVLPVGTGNLLSRNLRLPLRLRPAVRTALDGVPRPLDLMRYQVLDGPPVLALMSDGTPRPLDLTRNPVPDGNVRGYGVVMAGVGADAAVVADASDRLKRLGPLGYVIAGRRHVRARPVETRVAVGSEVLARQASLVEVGNLGELREGLPLLIDADGSDGVLNVLVASPRHVGDVLRMMAGVVGRARRIPFTDRRTGGDIVIHCGRPTPCQVDGDFIGLVSAIRFEVLPAAARVVVPVPPGPRLGARI